MTSPTDSQRKTNIAVNRSATVFVILTILLAHTALTLAGSLHDWDKQTTARFADFQNPLVTVVMVAATLFGTDPPLLILAIILSLSFARRGLRQEGVFLMLAAVLGRATGTVTKLIFQAPRPDLWQPPWPLQPPVTYGYPSGHALMSMVVFGGIAFLFYRLTPNVKSRMAMIAACGGLILCIGLSRVYVGVHWINDIIGGYLYGAFVLIVAERVVDWTRRKKVFRS